MSLPRQPVAVVFDMDDPLWLEPPPSPSSFRARHQLLGTLIRWPAKADALLRVCSRGSALGGAVTNDPGGLAERSYSSPR